MKRRDPDQWGRIIGKHRESGLSARAFCRREGVGLSRFYQWRQRLSDGGESSRAKKKVSEESFINIGGVGVLGHEEARKDRDRSFEFLLDLGDGVRLTVKRF